MLRDTPDPALRCQLIQPRCSASAYIPRPLSFWHQAHSTSFHSARLPDHNRTPRDTFPTLAVGASPARARMDPTQPLSVACFRLAHCVSEYLNMHVCSLVPRRPTYHGCQRQHDRHQGRPRPLRWRQPSLHRRGCEEAARLRAGRAHPGPPGCREAVGAVPDRRVRPGPRRRLRQPGAGVLLFSGSSSGGCVGLLFLGGG